MHYDTTDLAPHEFRPCSSPKCGRTVRDGDRCRDHTPRARIAAHVAHLVMLRSLYLSNDIVSGKQQYTAEVTALWSQMKLWTSALKMLGGAPRKAPRFVLEQLREESDRLRLDLDDALTSGDGIPQAWWVRQQRERLAMVEEQIREIEEG